MDDVMIETTLILTVLGCAALVITIVAWIADKRRHNRTNIDRVGFMPWTGVFFWSLMASIVLLGLAAKG